MSAEQEIGSGERFGFGANWTRFLAVLDDRRISEAESSLREMLAVEHLQGKRFLDIGCGSGLFSLAARRLGAKVHSFDFDPRSVACTQELKRRYFTDDETWHIEEGSVLDRAYLETLGQFDIVYSWGVLHHTGAMWLAMEHAINRVEHSHGQLFIAIYNDQGWKSRLWWLIKSFYNRLPRLLKPPFVAVMRVTTQLLVTIKYAIKLQPMTAIAPLLRDARERGMSAKYDEVDWVGGFPYEFSSFETLQAYLEARGFSLTNAKRTTGWGCNELAVRRLPCAG
jgi:2-polyprenyl-6-hydroxyphenyl methylase/3-demethylubiquinone-9 3-methyltransferase